MEEQGFVCIEVSVLPTPYAAEILCISVLPLLTSGLVRVHQTRESIILQEGNCVFSLILYIYGYHQLLSISVSAESILFYSLARS